MGRREYSNQSPGQNAKEYKEGQRAEGNRQTKAEGKGYSPVRDARKASTARDMPIAPGARPCGRKMPMAATPAAPAARHAAARAGSMPPIARIGTVAAPVSALSRSTP